MAQDMVKETDVPVVVIIRDVCLDNSTRSDDQVTRLFCLEWPSLNTIQGEIHVWPHTHTHTHTLSHSPDDFNETRYSSYSYM